MTPNQHAILLVEDNAISRKMMHFTLANKGYRVLDAPDGKTAVTLMRESPSLVLLDLKLPDTTGFELLHRLRAEPNGAQIPMLVCSGFISQTEEMRLSAAGFDDVLTKPIEPSRLLQIVHAYLPPETPVADGASFSGRILIADDDPVQRKLAIHKMQRVGFETIGVADGREALEKARACKPDAIVSDILMPGLDGFGLCQAVRGDASIAQIPVVLTTNSYVEAADLQLAQKIGADEFVVRTPDFAGVIAAVCKHLAKRQTNGRSAPRAPSTAPLDIERERTSRIMSQLDKQVTLNAGLLQRCASLSVELSIVSGISGALTHGLQIDRALDATLSACMDAGGIEQGALFILNTEGGVDTRVIGHSDEAAVKALGNSREQIFKMASQATTLVLNGRSANIPAQFELPAAIAQRHGVIVPMIHEEPVGLLLILSKDAAPIDQDRLTFAEGVANQIALALSLARSFARRAESERRANETASILTSILESLTDSVIAVDRHGKITHTSNAESMVGAAPAENWAAQRSFYRGDGTTPLSGEELPLNCALRGEVVNRSELFMQRSSQDAGTWYSVTARPLRAADGEIYGAVEVARDVTSDKNVQTQLMMSDRLASLGMLAAGVAHEINNPLAAILVNLECAARDVQAFLANPESGNLGEIGDELRDARQAAERVRNIVRDLRIFSRNEEDKSGVVDVRAVLESTVRMAWNEIRHRARLVEDYGAIPPVDANESRLGQVFLNLVMNAAQAIPPGAADTNEIRIRTGVAGDKRVFIAVEDTGSGIPPEILKRLFTPFVTSKPRGVGTGLGLAICQRIIKSLRGEIQVESTVGKGTTFRVLLPPAEVLASEAPSEQAASSATRRGRVLVIDDERAVGLGVKRMISPEHDVVALEDAREGLRLIMNGEHFDVILCDLMMPVCTGIEFYRTLMALRHDLGKTVIFLTGGAFAPYARDFLEKVPNMRLEKPFDLQALRTAVNERIR